MDDEIQKLATELYHQKSVLIMEADNHKLTEWQDEYQKWVCYLLTLHGMGPTYRKSGEENVRKQPWLFKKLQNLPFSFKDFTLINK